MSRRRSSSDIKETLLASSPTTINDTLPRACIDTSKGKRIGSDSVNGEALLSEVCSKNSCANVSYKLIPLKNDDLRFVGDTRLELWAELQAMRLCTDLVDNDICPNLPVMYSYSICDACRFTNQAVQKQYGRDRLACVISVNEYAQGGDLKHWCRKPRSDLEYAVAFFHIFAGLYAIQHWFDMVHYDLHWGNVLLLKNQDYIEGGVVQYTIAGQDYLIPDSQFTFILWDFGYANISGKIEIARLRDYYKSEDQSPKYLIDYARIANTPKWANDLYGIPVSESLQNFDKGIRQCLLKGFPVATAISHIFDDFKKERSKMSSVLPVKKYNCDGPSASLATETLPFLRLPSLGSRKMLNIANVVPNNTPMTKKDVDVLMSDYANNGSAMMVVDN